MTRIRYEAGKLFYDDPTPEQLYTMALRDEIDVTKVTRSWVEIWTYFWSGHDVKDQMLARGRQEYGLVFFEETARHWPGRRKTYVTIYGKPLDIIRWADSLTTEWGTS